MVIFAINIDTLKTMGKFAFLMVGFLLIIYFIAVLTPLAAKKIDSMRNNPERVKSKAKKGLYDFDRDELNGVYDAQISADDIKNENGDDLDNGK